MSETSRKSVLFVIAGLCKGGGETQFANLVNNFDFEKHDCTVVIFTGSDKIQFDMDTRINVIALDRTKYSSLIAAAAVYYDLIKLIRRIQPDAVIAFLNLANQFVRLTRPFYRKKTVIITSMRMNFRFYPKKWTILEKITSKLSTYVVHNSVRSAEYSKNILKPLKGNVMVPNSCDLDAINAFPSAKEKSYDFICVGRLIELKNHHVLVDAVARLKEGFSDIRVLIIGSGDREQAVKEHVEKAGLGQNIEFLPKTDKIFHYYGLSKFSILISHHEGFPNVILESLAKKLPCVISDQANGSDVIKDGMNGFICDAYSVESVAECMKKLMNMDNTEYAAMSCRAYDDVVENYSIPSMVRQYEKLINQEL